MHVLWLRMPAGWPPAVVALMALLLLTGLDLTGEVLAKEAVVRGSLPMAVLGALVFVVIFWVFASTLAVADLSAVTVGWCVLITVGVLVLDRFRYGVHLSAGKYVAVAVALVALTYLVSGPPAKAQTDAAQAPEVRVSLEQLLATSTSTAAAVPAAGLPPQRSHAWAPQDRKDRLPVEEDAAGGRSAALVGAGRGIR